MILYLYEMDYLIFSIVIVWSMDIQSFVASRMAFETISFHGVNGIIYRFLLMDVWCLWMVFPYIQITFMIKQCKHAKKKSNSPH